VRTSITALHADLIGNLGKWNTLSNQRLQTSMNYLYLIFYPINIAVAVLLTIAVNVFNMFAENSISILWGVCHGRGYSGKMKSGTQSYYSFLVNSGTMMTDRCIQICM
jgi:hypothetical protein